MAESFTGTWKSTNTSGEMDKFFTERGLPYPVRKIIEYLTSRGEFIFEIVDTNFVETEVGTFKNTAKEPLPLDGTAVQTVAPDGQKAMTKLVVEDQVMKIVNTFEKDGDTVTHELSKDGDTIIRKVINGKTGTFFTITLTKK